MTIFITGGAGFIGANFIHQWLENSDETVVNIDKLTYAGNLENLKGIDANYHFVKGDIADTQLWERILAEHKPRAILNFAAESHVDRSIHGPSDFIETNIVGMYRLLEVSRDYWSSLPEQQQLKFRFLHVSTDEVYGTLVPEAPEFDEQNQYKPNSPYSASKAASDHLVRAWNKTYGLPALTTNCSNNYGPFQFPEKLIPLIINNCLEGKDLPIYGDGQQIRDWLYVGDHCIAINKILEYGRIGETYNIGGNNEITNIEAVKTICSLLDELSPRLDGIAYETQIKFVKDRPGHDRRYAVNSSKLINELNWRAIEDVKSGFRKTVEWYLENTNWVERVKSGAYREWQEKQYGNE